tara:strand:- start:176 stop:922 length:747 start_codon:yes stop_codon:yes gene_type:complete
MYKNDEISSFYKERTASLKDIQNDKELKKKSIEWMIAADKYKYTYNFSWMGRPIIKYPADMIVQQELMWNLRPDLIIETGIAHGGSIIFSASMMKMMGIKGEVIGVDIDIREHNRSLIEDHPMSDIIEMYEGSSIDINIIKKIKEKADKHKTILVILDSCHSHEHVFNELLLYSQFVTKNSYIILPDTFIEFFPKGYYAKNRPWDKGNNPYTALKSFLKSNDNFIIDKDLSSKACITETIDGYLKKIK